MNFSMVCTSCAVSQMVENWESGDKESNFRNTKKEIKLRHKSWQCFHVVNV